MVFCGALWKGSGDFLELSKKLVEDEHAEHFAERDKKVIEHVRLPWLCAHDPRRNGPW